MHRAAARRVSSRGGQLGDGAGQRTRGKRSRQADREGSASSAGCGPSGGACGISSAGEEGCRQGRRHPSVVEGAPSAFALRGRNLVLRRSHCLRQSRRTGSTSAGGEDSSAPRVGESACASFHTVRGLSQHLQQHESHRRDCAMQRRNVLALDHPIQRVHGSWWSGELVIA
jgi:hypothetical protein